MEPVPRCEPSTSQPHWPVIQPMRHRGQLRVNWCPLVVVVLHLPIGPLIIRYGLQPVPRCEPSTYQPHWPVIQPIRNRGQLRVNWCPLVVLVLHLPIGSLIIHYGLQPVRRCEPSTYQPHWPVIQPIRNRGQLRVNWCPLVVLVLHLPIGSLIIHYGLQPVRRCEPSTYQPYWQMIQPMCNRGQLRVNWCPLPYSGWQWKC